MEGKSTEKEAGEKITNTNIYLQTAHNILYILLHMFGVVEVFC